MKMDFEKNGSSLFGVGWKKHTYIESKTKRLYYIENILPGMIAKVNLAFSKGTSGSI